MERLLEKCEICPHKCKVNSIEGKRGVCKAPYNPKIALYSTHDFEEPCISGKKAQGLYFFQIVI